MLHTLLTWHLTATAVLLVTYGLVVGLQWSAVRLRRLAVDLERRRAAGPAAAVREADGAPRHALRGAV